MMAQVGNYGNGMSFTSPPKQAFNFNPMSPNESTTPSSQRPQVSEDTPQTQTGVMAPSRRLSLPEGMDQVFDSDFTINDLIQTGNFDNISPTKILGGFEENMNNDFVPAMYDSSALMADGNGGFSLNNLSGYDDDHMKMALGGLVDESAVKMEMESLQG